jgi:hypothetical protein
MSTSTSFARVIMVLLLLLVLATALCTDGSREQTAPLEENREGENGFNTRCRPGVRCFSSAVPVALFVEEDATLHTNSPRTCR